MVCAVVLGLCAGLWAQEQPKKPFLHPLFSDNMVLQREVKTPVWGWTTPGAEVTVELDGKTASCKAGDDGKWLAELPAHKVGGPFVLKVSGPETAVRENVLLGDVWICSGQSNMEMGIRNCMNADMEVAASANPNIRLFTVPKKVAFDPEPMIYPVQPSQAKWLVCGPDTVGLDGWGGFSAASYFFGRELYKATEIPIGLIHTSWGGTIAEAWTSSVGLETIDDFKDRLANYQALVEKIKTGQLDFAKEMNEWWASNDPGSKDGWAAADLDSSDWKLLEGQPQPWEECGLPNVDGIVWLRKTVELPAAWADAEATLSLAMIDDMDTTFVNSVEVGGMDNWQSPRKYTVPKGTLKPGKNVIAIRVLDTGGGGGLHGEANAMALAAEGQAPVSLVGTWQYKIAVLLAAVKPAPKKLDGNPNQTTVLFNGMIAPLLPFAIKGAIWYQGEANAGQPMVYRRLLPAMIKDWRNRFGVGDFPFLIVQLANFMAVQETPTQDGWAAIRESQYLISRDVPNAGLASAIDIGDGANIHPKNKQEVGRRLALIACAKTYGQQVEYSGPVYASMDINGNEVVLKFDHVGGGLIAKGETLQGFAIAGEDGKCVYADAKIVGDTVVVSAPGVPAPTVVYYGWANNPVCNLYNKDGLPAVSFRTRSE
jgi:sialate O-acetylesterase